MKERMARNMQQKSGVYPRVVAASIKRACDREREGGGGERERE